MKTNTRGKRGSISATISTPDQSKSKLLLLLIGRPDFLLPGLAGALMLATVYYWLLLQGSNLNMLIENIRSEPVYSVALKILASTALLLFGLNFGLSTILFRAGGTLKSTGGSLLGGLVGGFGVGCPACGAFLLSLIGVSAGLVALPFAGLELWVGSAAVMAMTLGSALTRLDRSTCDPQAKTAICWRLPAMDTRLIMVFALLSLGLASNLAWMLYRYG